MLKMLVIEDNVIQCKQLVNFISSISLDIKLYSMSFCGNEALEIIKNELVDMIFLDLVLPDISGLEILQFIENNHLEKYKQSVIIVSGNVNLYPDLINNPYIYSIIPKPVKWSILSNCLNEFIAEKESLVNEYYIKSKIYEELEYLCYNLSHIGTTYLCECIFLLYFSDNYDDNLSKNIYPIVAKKYGTTPNNIKCNIFQATNISYYECEENKLKSYFYNFLHSKPKTKDVISEVLKHLNKNTYIKM